MPPNQPSPGLPADPPPKEAETADTFSVTALLLNLVRGLIGHGEAVMAAFYRPRTPETYDFITTAFGTHDIRLIIRRVTRGLMLAAALQRWIAYRSRYFDKNQPPGPRPPGDPANARSAPKPPRTPGARRPSDDEALLARLPTVEEIDRIVRRRPIGAVLVDICHDLGITVDHPAWDALHDVVYRYRGSLLRLMRDIGTRAGLLPPPRSARPRPAPGAGPDRQAGPASPFAAATGPP